MSNIQLLTKQFNTLEDYQRFCNTMYDLEIEYDLQLCNFNSKPSTINPLIVTFGIYGDIKIIETIKGGY